MNPKSKELFERAQKVIPGGVNSPVRAFGAVGGSPRFIKKANGSRMTDEDGNEYIDYIGSWGPMILGHRNAEVEEAAVKAARDGLSFGAATEIEVEMAELVCDTVPCVEMIRMCSSGTEAVMSALRVARGFTGREKIVKFRGCYHGHSDAMLVTAGSGVLTAGRPDSAGVTKGTAKDTLLADYNDLQSVKDIFECNRGEIAAVIVEPVAANMGVVLPEDGFLQGLRDITQENDAVLIFDEVITGFRLAPGGAAEYFGIMPDLVTYGKIIGGGMPVGAYGGKKEIMKCVAPVGAVYQAGTLSGNPVAMAAGLKTVQILKNNTGIYAELNKKAQKIAGAFSEKKGIATNQIGSLLSAFFTDSRVKDLQTAKTSDTEKYAAYFNHMLKNGIYVAPAQFEAMFLSAAHTDEDIEKTILAIQEF
ncbi:glutamate-1-semialdehyde 2,1-aminomutase [Christensenella tenuis]|jgi:glutamate-1-semialdehyde 2,1-aminomutase|uniref:Glutamate-1-semialdehyde 2,1-aminomutase n=1 Tax=Christensenella tenuis TaxID=2763033 RepID=A0ABR7EJJ2_9FIRM|nr:glutamate-1-semialdehyde 2,1-aminomutase [Christensenella tenuis]MBC5649179.1 glutamate-1-semialdehyde 2,1-aminomutase [Christensenella tenuis]